MKHEFSQQTLSTECCGENLLLHPDKVIYWPARKTLLAADIHVGKEATFARAGIPVPGGISEQTLNTLMRLLDDSQSERLIILGDLLHSTPRLSEPWQQHLSTLLAERKELTVEVIIGNHDSKAARDNVVANLKWVSGLYEPPFLFKHEPCTDKSHYVIAGHIHPVYRLKNGRRQSLKAPVFWFNENYAVLPAFGEFTGGHVIEREQSDRLFMIGGGQIVEV